MEQSSSNKALQGKVLPTFLTYLIPSVIGLLAMSTASIVDGIFIGNYVGSDALAAVNLIMPFMSLLFGLTLTLSIGGSVRAGKFIGENNIAAASAIFSKTLVVMTFVGILIGVFGYFFHEPLFKSFGANDVIKPLMAEYFIIMLPFFLPQILMIVLYFFIRIDGYPNLAAAALALGSIVNIVLDYLFIAVFDWGLKGAGLATGLAQLIPFLILLVYFLKKDRKLKFSFKQNHWFEVFKALYNGLSEFINEISAGIITFILNWLLISSVGVQGVAAITVINYLLMIGFMMFFSLGDACQVVISQNFGAKQPKRISQFLTIAFSFSLIISAICITLLLVFPNPLVNAFLKEDDVSAIALATDYIKILWAIFLVAGLNMIISAYLTAIHLPKQSAIVSICRSLLLPGSLLLILYFFVPSINFLWALPVGELLTFLIAAWLFIRHMPDKAIAEETN